MDRFDGNSGMPCASLYAHGTMPASQSGQGAAEEVKADGKERTRAICSLAGSSSGKIRDMGGNT